MIRYTQPERREPGRYIAAAVRVLAAAGRPLTAGEIAEEAVARGLIRPDSASPAAAMFSTLKRHEYGGPVVRLADTWPARWTLRAPGPAAVDGPDGPGRGA